MTLLHQYSGCKVGWSYFDSEADAKECAAQASAQRDRMFAQGYDFGYQWPGSIKHYENHPEYGECWMVVTP